MTKLTKEEAVRKARAVASHFKTGKRNDVFLGELAAHGYVIIEAEPGDAVIEKMARRAVAEMEPPHKFDDLGARARNGDYPGLDFRNNRIHTVSRQAGAFNRGGEL